MACCAIAQTPLTTPASVNKQPPFSPTFYVGKNISGARLASTVSSFSPKNSDQTIVIVASSQCAQCKNFAVQIPQLEAKAVKSHTKVITAMHANDATASQFQNAYGIKSGMVAFDFGVPIVLVPTVLVCDSTGKITHAYVGALSGAQFTELMGLIQ